MFDKKVIYDLGCQQKYRFLLVQVEKQVLHGIAIEKPLTIPIGIGKTPGKGTAILGEVDRRMIETHTVQ